MENQERRGEGMRKPRGEPAVLCTLRRRRDAPPGPMKEDDDDRAGETDRNEAERCGAEQQPAGLCLAATAYRGPTKPGPRKAQTDPAEWVGLARTNRGRSSFSRARFPFLPSVSKTKSVSTGREREREREAAMAEAQALVLARGPDEAPLDASAIRRWANDPPFPSPLGGSLLPVDLVPQSALFPFCFVCVFVSAGWSSSLWNGGVGVERRRRSRRRLRMWRWHWVWTPRTR